MPEKQRPEQQGTGAPSPPNPPERGGAPSTHDRTASVFTANPERQKKPGSAETPRGQLSRSPGPLGSLLRSDVSRTRGSPSWPSSAALCVNGLWEDHYVCGWGRADNTLEHGGREDRLVSLLFSALPLSPCFGATSSPPIETWSSADCGARASRGQVMRRRNGFWPAP
ncbi:hypothetical protein MJT46_018201 [Ovis ammon polii x Ovis aries]|nr:hypothetical protein MJT46_018201 [Ovis ammon polii x Ovis aries]